MHSIWVSSPQLRRRRIFPFFKILSLWRIFKKNLSLQRIRWTITSQLTWAFISLSLCCLIIKSLASSVPANADSRPSILLSRSSQRLSAKAWNPSNCECSIATSSSNSIFLFWSLVEVVFGHPWFCNIQNILFKFLT